MKNGHTHDLLRKHLPFLYEIFLEQPAQNGASFNKKVGIDRIREYLSCIQLEQKFLSRFPVAYVTDILAKYHEQYGLLVENLCEIVLMSILSPMVRGKKVKSFGEALDTLIRDYYEDDVKLKEYLCTAVGNVEARLRAAEEHSITK